jgi:hypothetical protein
VVLVVEERVAGVVEIHLDGHARLGADLLHHLTGPVRRDELVVLAGVALDRSPDAGEVLVAGEGPVEHDRGGDRLTGPGREVQRAENARTVIAAT